MSLNIGFITWIIKKNDFRHFHTCKMGETMLSEEVTTQNMQWYLKCFPNGSKHKFEGWVGLSLTLKKTTIPANITNVLVRYYLYESQSSSISRGIARFNKNSIQEIKTEKQIKPVGRGDGYAKSNGTNYLVELDALKKYDIIILKCEFEIIRMYKLNKLIYGYPLKLSKIISYQWNIANKHLDKFKITENPYTRLYSQEFNIWNLVLVPCATTYNSKGNISLRLRLYEMPPIIKSIKIIVVVTCNQFNKSWTTTADLSYEQPWIAWPANTLKKSIVDERIFDEKTNNTQNALKCLRFECKIEVLSITLYKLNNLHNLTISESDSKYKNVWCKFIMDDNNVFMRKRNDTYDNTEEHEADSKMNYENQYDITERDIEDGLEDDDEYLVCKKEDIIRQKILRSLDLTEESQKNYLMAKVHAMQENIRVLRKEKQQNKKMLKQLQSMMVSMQKNMKAMERQIGSVTKKKAKDDDNELFIKRMKKEKAKRDKKKGDDNDGDSSSKSKKRKKKRKTSKDSATPKIEEKNAEEETNKDSKDIVTTPKKRKGLTAKQQLFKTWMDMVVNLPQYFELFLEAGYEDLTYVENMQLTEQDLTQIGIQKRGHRQKILQEIKKMKPKKDISNVSGDDGSMNVSPNTIEDGFTSINANDIGGDGGMGDDLYLNIDNQDDNNDETGW